jgi:rubrerythrin
MRYVGWWILVIFVFFSSMAFKFSDTTLENLQKAYQKEAYQMQKYELYSIKAKSEGYPNIAALFHAASTSEAVHMKNHERIIESMGSKVESTEYAKVAVNSTKENLNEPIKELNEEQTFYSELIEQAKENKKAKESFEFAKEAEQQHVQLFRKAAENMEAYPDCDYYVSQVTGATYKIEKEQKADNGNTGYDKYLKTEQ